MIRQKKLTKFQAEEISKGQGKSLTLGNYVMLEKIGQGGMGAVYKARHQRLDRVVAIKVLPAAMTKDRGAIARFEREVKAAAKLEHANIVTAHDADQANGVHFLVMRFVEGSDLSVLVKKNGPFRVTHAVNYVLQAAPNRPFHQNRRSQRGTHQGQDPPLNLERPSLLFRETLRERLPVQNRSLAMSGAGRICESNTRRSIVYRDRHCFSDDSEAVAHLSHSQVSSSNTTPPG